MGTREAAWVRAVVHDDRFSPPAAYLMLEWSGGAQGFGGLHLDEAVGMECTVLWSRGRFNDPIEGLELEGRRFTITGFRRKRWPDKVPSADEVFLSALEEGYTDWEHAPL